MEITNNINLGELSEQVGHANLIITCLPECDGDHDSSKEVSDGAAEVCVLASELQDVQEDKKGA